MLDKNISLPMNNEEFKGYTERRDKVIKKEVIKEIIFDILFNSLVNEKGTIEFDRYNIDEKNMLYLLRKYDEEKFEEYKNMLINDCKKD